MPAASPEYASQDHFLAATAHMGKGWPDISITREAGWALSVDHLESYLGLAATKVLRVRRPACGSSLRRSGNLMQAPWGRSPG